LTLVLLMVSSIFGSEIFSAYSTGSIHCPARRCYQTAVLSNEPYLFQMYLLLTGLYFIAMATFTVLSAWLSCIAARKP
jgi:hypothetical protein